jgi:hypothetical protein
MIHAVVTRDGAVLCKIQHLDKLLESWVCITLAGVCELQPAVTLPPCSSWPVLAYICCSRAGPLFILKSVPVWMINHIVPYLWFSVSKSVTHYYCIIHSFRFSQIDYEFLEATIYVCVVTVRVCIPLSPSQTPFAFVTILQWCLLHPLLTVVIFIGRTCPLPLLADPQATPRKEISWGW